MTPVDFEKKYVWPRVGRSLIVGSKVYGAREDRHLLYPAGAVLGVDMEKGPGVDRVLNLEDPLPPDLGTFVHVDCLSVLEHATKPWLLAANIETLLEQSGTLFLTVPFVWKVHAYPSDYWRFIVEGVQELFPRICFKPLVYSYDGEKFPRVSVEGDPIPYFQRTEVFGFGVKKGMLA